MRLCRIALLAAVLGCPAAASADEPAALAEARRLYNAGRFDAAIESAAAARKQAAFADAAALVMARAYLERFRAAGEPADLTSARHTLLAVRAPSLSQRDQVDLLIGLGQTLFLNDVFGPAAELFATALARAELLSAADRALLLDWWASAIDREAQSRGPEGRPPLFARIATRMQEEIAVNPGSAVANYWLAVAARGEGDLERAWDAAVAAWVRSPLIPATRDTLRADIDRFVLDALIPERVRPRPARDQEDAAAALRAEWEGVKDLWR
jgi:hypothetical protein